MWVFYFILLPLTMGMVAITLWYFAGPDVPRYVRFTVGYTWFSSVAIVMLVPADIWTTITNRERAGVSFFWSWSYWSTFLLTWTVVPIIQGYEDAGDFTVAERLRTSAHVNLLYYLCVGAIGLFGIILLILLRKSWSGNILGFAMACSNTFGLVTGAFLLGFGLSEIPKGMWRDADWTHRQKVLSHKVAKMAVKLDDAHQDFSNAIVVSQATSKQMSRRDPLRAYMTVIDKMLLQMLNEDPSFKPQGGQFGENDMDYDTDAKTMAALRRQLVIAREEYYRQKSEYMNFVMEALELEETIKNHEHLSFNEWKYVSSFRPQRSGRIGSVLDTVELFWRCLVKKQLEKLSAIVLGCMSAAILLAEATILSNGVNLSLFSVLINQLKHNEVLEQVAVLIPLMYMCMCTYYSLFKIGMLTFYSFTPKRTNSVSLLMICSMVARYAPPISYNFLNLVVLDNGAKTIFEQNMGNIDDIVPFFGKGFNTIYPLIMVVYTLLIACNFFDRVLSYFGNWRIFKVLQSEEADDLDGFDPSGLMILQRERVWLEQGHKVGELVVPLARTFSNTNTDIESGANHLVSHETKASSSLMEESSDYSRQGSKREYSRQGSNGEYSRQGSNREYSRQGSNREYSRQGSNREYKYMGTKPNKQEYELSSKEVSTPSSQNSGNYSDQQAHPSSKVAMTWESMKSGFRNFKSNIEAKRFISLRQDHVSNDPRASSSLSLDDIFERIKRPSPDRSGYGQYDDDFDD